MTRYNPSRFRLQKNIRWLTRRREGLLKRLRRIGPFLNGSLVLIERTCGNKQHCHCLRGPKHISTYLTYGLRGKTRTLYIPVDLEKEAHRWSGNYRQLKKLIREISDVQRAIIRLHVQERRRRR